MKKKNMVFIAVAIVISLFVGFLSGASVQKKRQEEILFSAEEIIELSTADLEYFEGKQMMVVGATVNKIDLDLELITADVGYIHFDEDDIYKVRTGEKITFCGELRVSQDWVNSFSDAVFVSVNEMEETE